MRFLFFLLLFFFFWSAAIGQKVTTFQKTLGGSDSEYGNTIIETADGGFMILGTTDSYGAGGYDLMVSRTDSLGRELWSKTYGGSSDEGIDVTYGRFSAMIQTYDSTYVIVSSTKSYGKGGSDVYLIKINKTGSVLWTRTYGGTSDEVGLSVVELSNKGLTILGMTESYGSGSKDVLLIHTNDTGGIVWAKAYGGNSYENVFSLAISSLDSSYYIAGECKSISLTTAKALVMKVHKSGALTWSKVFGASTKWEIFLGIAEDTKGNIYASGQSEGFAVGGSGDCDLYLTKMDSSGNILWSKTYGNSTYRQGGRDIFINNNKIYWNGWSRVGTVGQNVFWALEIDTAGSLSWLREYTVAGNTYWPNYGSHHKILKNGGLITIGSITGAYSIGSYDYYLVKTNSSGVSSTCSSTSVSPSINSHTPSHYSHSFSTSNLSLDVSKGYTIGSASMSDTFVCEPFIADFRWSNPCTGVQIQFFDSTYTNADDWLWTISDPYSTHKIDSSQNPVHTFNYPGTYTVKLVVWKGTNKDSVTKSIAISDEPVFAVSGDVTVCMGNPAPLSAYVSGSGLNYYWSPGKYLDDSTSLNPKAYISADQKFVFSVSNGGCKLTDTVNIKVRADCPQPMFQRYYGGSSNDDMFGAAEARNGDLFLVGTSASYASGATDIYLTRTDSAGQVKWSKRYGGSGADYGRGIILVGDTSLFIVGHTNSFSLGSYDIYIICLDTSGNVKWSKTYGGSGTDEAYEIMRTSTGHYMVVGTYTSSSSSTDHLVFKIDGQGNLIWSRIYGGSSAEKNGKIKELQDGSYIIVANTTSFGVSSDDAVVMKIDSSGQLLWYKTYGGSGSDGGHGIVEFSDGTLLINGTTTSAGSGSKAYVLNVDSTGSLTWSKYFSATSSKNDGSSQIIRISATEAVLLGNATSYGGGDADITLTKMDTSGSVSWVKSYGRTYLDYNSWLVNKLANGGFLAGGRTKSFNSNSNEDGYLIRTDRDGNSNCFQTDTAISLNSFSITVGNPTVSSSSVSLSVGTGANTSAVNLANGIGCISIHPDFSWTSVCAGKPMQFYDSSKYEVTKWRWYFSDPYSTHNTDSIKNPSHTFILGGLYPVKLVVENAFFKDSVTKTITVAAPPISVYNDTTICFGKAADLGVTSSVPGMSYLWKPAHLVSDSTAAFPQAYPAVTTDFIVYATDTNGCMAIDTIKVEVDTAGCSNVQKIGGVINLYTKVTAIDSCNNTVTVESDSGYGIGDKVLLIQMKGAIADSSNTSSYGSVLDIGDAGNAEYLTIDTIAGSVVTFTNKIQKHYSPHYALQLVRVPQYQDVYVTSELSAGAWDGEKGGILAFDASGMVYMGADMDASKSGFSGGSLATEGYQCHSTGYYYNSTSLRGANKGEGIGIFSSSYAKGLGANINGGGGGNDHNAGGAGGSNYATGGGGGKEWSSCGSPIFNGGIGGYSLSAYYTNDKRIFMGGGGGAGHSNNSQGTSGANGGGIVLIRASALYGENKTILAEGGDVTALAEGDGSGAGGAGGTIVLDIPSIYTKVNIKAGGGEGGSTKYNTTCVGPGGGGGGGVLLLSNSSVASNISGDLSGGSAGIHTNSGSSCYGTSWGAAAGNTGTVLAGYTLTESSDTFTPPPGSASGPVSVCKNDSAQLSATGGVAYAWYPSAYFNDTTLANPKAQVDQKRKFYVRIYNANGCYKLDSVEVDTVANEKLDPPTICSISYEGDSSIRVTWTPTNDSTGFSYYILKSTAPGSTGSYIYSDTIYGRLTDNYLFTRGSSLIGGQVKFALQSVNACGLAGDLSDAKRSMVLNVTMLSSGNTARLSWSNTLAAEILEKNEGTGWSTLLNTLVFHQYDYTRCDFDGKFRAYYEGGNPACKSYSNEVSIAWQDTTGPSVPDIRYIYHNAAWWSNPYVWMYAWLQPEGSSIPGRAVVSRSKNGGSWQVIDTFQAYATHSKPNYNFQYTDSTSNKQVNDKYCYRLQGIDSCGNLSDVYDEKCAPVLTVTPGNLKMTLVVGNMTNLPAIPNYSYYYFWRRKATEQTYTYLGVNSTGTYIDSDVNCYDSYNYFAYAYHYVNTPEGATFYGGYSNYVEDVSFDTIPPSPTVLRYATVASKTSNKVVFSQASDNYIKQYFVYGAKNGGSFSLLDSVASNNSSVYTYEHTGIDPLNDTWCYYVKVEDSCTVSLSMPSDTHCVINLSATASYTTVSLNWSKYMGDEVNNYKIERRTNGGPWVTIDNSIPATTFTYVDKDLECGTNYDYRIYAAMVTNASYITYSDSVRVKTNTSTFSYTVSGPQFMCTNDSAQLYATGGIKYIWGPDSLLNDTSLANPKGLVTRSTKFYVRIYDSTGCYVTDTVEVDTVNITKLKPPTLHCASIEGDSIVKLTWTPTIDTSFFGSYIIARTEPGGSSFVHEDTVYGGRTVSTYTYSKEFRTDSLPVRFKMFTVNSCGSRGDKSNEMRTIALAHSIVDDKTVSLSWNQPLDSGIWAKDVQKNEGSGWSFAGSSSSGKYTYRNCAFDGGFRVVYEDTINGCTSYSNVTNVEFVDTTPAPQPEIKRVSVSNLVNIHLNYVNQKDITNVKEYKIYQWKAGDTSKVLAGTTGAASLPPIPNAFISFHPGKLDSNQWCFTIVAIDSCGNISDSAETHCMTHLSGTAGNLRNTLTWKPYMGLEVDTQEVQRKEGSVWVTLAKFGAGATSFIDSGLICNVLYTYRITSRRKGGSGAIYDNTLSNEVTLTPFDTIPPERATIVHLDIASANSAYLTFYKSPSPDAYYYHIYKTTNGTGYEKIMTKTKHDLSGIGQLQQLITGLQTANNRYCFYVVVQDSCGENYSDSAGVCAPELRTTAGNQRVTLNWHPYEGPDPITEYLIKRSTDGVNFITIDTVPGTDTTYTNIDLECNKKYTYRIDPRFPQPGTTSIWFVVKSDTASATPFDTISPAEVNMQYASVVNSSSIELVFKKVADKDVNRYEIWRSNNGGSYQKVTTLYYPSGDPVIYTDPNLNTTANTYCYKIYAIDSCEDNISLSAEEHCPVQLSGSPGNNANHLNWTAYQGFITGEHIIQRRDALGNWTDLDTVNGSTFSYVDTLIACDITQYYKIKANNSDSTEGLISYWKFDETSGNAKDSYGENTLNNSNVVSFGSGKKNNAADLERSSSQYFTIDDTAQSGLDLSSTATFSLWIKMEALPSAGSGPSWALFSKGNQGVDFSYQLSIDYIHNNLVFSYSSNGIDSRQNSYEMDQRFNAADVGVWRHIVIVLNAANETCKFYLDGVLMASTTLASNSATSIFNSSDPFRIGALRLNSGSVTSFFDGMIDEVSIWSRDLTATEILSIYNYGINGITSSQSASSFSDSIALTPFDTIKPEAPVLRAVSVVSDKQVSLNWTKSTSPDVRNYVIWRKPSSGATWAAIDTTGDVDTYTDTSINAPSGAYCYRIQAMDSCAENVSQFTETHCTIHFTTSTSGCEKSIYLSWGHYTGWSSIDKYEIYRRVNGGVESLHTTLNGSATSFKDSLLDYHNDYCYRVKAYENGGTNISWSNDSCNRTNYVDTPQVIRVTKLNSSSSNGEILVEWQNQAGRPYLAYHQLYYRSHSGSFTLLQDSIPVGQDSFVHTNINTRIGEHYYYLITIDSCDQKSDSSSLHKSMDITVTVGQLLHHINWTPYYGFDVKEYRIERLHGGIFEAIDTVPPTDTANVQFPAPCNFTIHYRIAAVSHAGVVAYSDTMGRVAIDTVIANPATMHQLTVVDNDHTYMTFTGSDSLDVYAYSIQVAKDGLWGTAGQVLFSSPAAPHDYTDTINTLKEQLCYTIITLDSCLNATMSDTFCAIQLKGQERNLSNFINWHKFEGYPIEEYALLYLTASGWDTLSKFAPNDTDYLHLPLQCNLPVSYRVAGQGAEYLTMSDTLVLAPYDTIRPAVPPVDFATVINGAAITLNWQPSSANDVRLYEIRYRSENADWIVADTLDRIYTYTFTGLNTLDSTYSFAVTALDSCAYNRSDMSIIHKTVQLTGEPKNLSNQLTWSTYEGFTVDKYYIYRYNGVNWQKHDSVASSITGYLDNGLQCNIPYYYQIRTLSSTGLVSLSDSISLVPFDTIRPVVPEVDFATVDDGTTISLYWQPSASSDVRLYEIRYKSGNGAWEVIDTLDRIYTYTFTGLNTLDSTYSFGVTAMDSCAYNRSGLSIIHRPVQLTGEPKNLSNLLNWSAYQGFTVNKYYIYRHDGSNWQKHDSVNASTTTYLDTGLQCNVPYFYQVRALSTSHFISRSDSISLTPFDTIKPVAPPVNYASVVNGSTIELHWQPSSSDVKVYEVWIKSANGSWQNIDTVQYQYDYFFTGLNTLDSTYSFRVVGIDSCADNRSAYSIIHTPVQLDGQPMNLSAGLNWSAYTGFAVKEYHIYRHAGNGWQIVDTVDGSATSYIHYTLPCNVPQYFRVSALDITESFLSFSDSIELTPFDTLLPPAQIIHYASVESSTSIKLAWHWDRTTDIKDFIIYRSVDGDVFTIEEVVTYDSTWVDNSVQPQKRSYAYYIIAVDSCGQANRSMPSDTETIMNLSLATGECTPQIRLNWSAYSDFTQATDIYEIYRSTDKINYILVQTVNSPQIAWDDNTVQEGTRYFYKIKAIDNESGYSSYSDTISMLPWVFPDPQPQAMVNATVVKTGTTGGSIEISWNGYDYLADTFARGYRLYHREGETGPYTVLHEEKDLTKLKFLHENINTASALHQYYVSVFNLCDVEGDSSNIHRPVNLELVNKNLQIELNWTPYEGRTPMYYTLYRSEDGGPMVPVATLTDDTSYIDSNVYCHKHYTYQVETQLYVNFKYASYSDTVGATAFDDTAPPVPDIILASVIATGAINGEIELLYTGNITKNRSGYNIYRREANQPFGLYTNENTIAPGGSRWVDNKAPTAKAPVSYYLTAIDSCGNESMPSDTHVTIYLKAEAKNGYIKLDWTPYIGWGDALEYTVFRREPMQALKPVKVVDHKTLSLNDSSVECHVIYEYIVTARNFINGHHTNSNFVQDSAFEIDPPAMNDIVRATVTATGLNDGATLLEWTPTVSSDHQYYHVYRSDNGGPWHQVGMKLTGTFFADKDLNTYQDNYAYALKLEDSCGNISAQGYDHQTMVLHVRPGDQTARLSWNSYKGWPVERYDIYRDGAAIGSVDGTQLYWQDEGITCTQYYRYQVRAVSALNNEVFSMSNLDSTKPFDYIAPHRPVIKRVTVSVPNNQVLIEWTASNAFDLNKYYIWKRSAKDGRLEIIDSTNASSYVYDMEIDAPDCFFIEAIDYCGNHSEWSNRGCIIYLQGTNGRGFNQLSWNAYEEWDNGVEQYNIYRDEDSLGYLYINFTKESSYKDESLNEDEVVQYCYKVEAVERNNGTLSRSTEICLYPGPVFYMPNTFTPQQSPDLLNDEFGPVGSYILKYDMSIYNRWGQLVHFTESSEPWSGRMRNGKVVPEGVYLYQITVYGHNDEKITKSGTITIIR